jgi:hypothetical protein
MGIKIGTRYPDAQHLSEELDRVRHCIDRAMEELARVKEFLPDPARLRALLTPAAPDDRRDLSNSCISLELALEDTRTWARRLADQAARRSGPTAPPADAGAPTAQG